MSVTECPELCSCYPFCQLFSDSAADDTESEKIATFCHDEHQKVKSTGTFLTVVLRTFAAEELYGVHGKYYSGQNLRSHNRSR